MGTTFIKHFLEEVLAQKEAGSCSQCFEKCQFRFVMFIHWAHKVKMLKTEKPDDGIAKGITVIILH